MRYTKIAEDGTVLLNVGISTDDALRKLASYENTTLEPCEVNVLAKRIQYVNESLKPKRVVCGDCKHFVSEKNSCGRCKIKLDSYTKGNLAVMHSRTACLKHFEPK